MNQCCHRRPPTRPPTPHLLLIGRRPRLKPSPQRLLQLPLKLLHAEQCCSWGRLCSTDDSRSQQARRGGAGQACCRPLPYHLCWCRCRCPAHRRPAWGTSTIHTWHAGLAARRRWVEPRAALAPPVQVPPHRVKHLRHSNGNRRGPSAAAEPLLALASHPFCLPLSYRPAFPAVPPIPCILGARSIDEWLTPRLPLRGPWPRRPPQTAARTRTAAPAGQAPRSPCPPWP